MKTKTRNPPAAKPRTDAKQRTPFDNLGIANIAVAQARTLTLNAADADQIIAQINVAIHRLNTAATQLLEREDTP